MAVICVDAGTTMIKAIGYDDEGNESAVARAATSVLRPRPAWAEQDMEAVWDAVVVTVRSVVDQLGADVEFVAFTGQGDGSWLVDSKRQPTGPAILWNDGRGAAILRRLDQVGRPRAGFPDQWLADLVGNAERHLELAAPAGPGRLSRSAASLTCGGWLFARMTGELAIDSSDGSAPFMDIRTREYSDELLGLYDMEWARPLLPRLRGDDQRVGELTRGAGEQLGLPAGTPVVMAPYDIASTAIGVGAVNDGQACCILGTTLCTEVVTDKVILGEQAAGITVALGLPGRYLRALPTLAGTEVIQWACKLMGFEDPFQLGELAAG